MIELAFQKLDDRAQLPTRSYHTDAGIDVFAFLLSETGHELTWTVPPREARTFPTGLRIRPPSGHAVFVLSRSGMAANGMFVANAPGLIDPDYRGELKVILYNGSPDVYRVRHGFRIAQLFVLPVVYAAIVEGAIASSETERGYSGFGSTGA